MDMDPVLLARLQFAFTISFHIIFPSFTIGLASYLAVLEALWLKTGDNAFHALYRYWLRIFALSFGLGVVSGVVMSYEFGTNWSRFSSSAMEASASAASEAAGPPPRRRSSNCAIASARRSADRSCQA